jgi:CTP synthase (UTP-ammonia lyase)
LRDVEARIQLKLGSRVSAIYGRNEVSEPFNCGFGPNPEYQHLFGNTALRITGTDEDNVARVVELDDHPFFIATLFQPERSALKDLPHPLITAFVHAVAASAKALQLQTNT